MLVIEVTGFRVCSEEIEKNEKVGIVFLDSVWECDEVEN